MVQKKKEKRSTRPPVRGGFSTHSNTHLTLCNLQQELRATNFDLERRVADRTHRLQVRTALSTKLNEISDLDKLLQILSNQLRDSFNYHYVQVYLVEAQTNHLVLAKGTGDIGQRMQAEQRHLPPGQGLVGLAVQNHEYVLCNNVAGMFTICATSFVA